jgi:hypothetical protein
MYRDFRLGNMKKRDGMENLDVDGTVIAELVLKIYYSREWTGFICPQDK